VQTPLSSDTINSVLGHPEVGQAKDLSAPLHIFIFVSAFSVTVWNVLKYGLSTCMFCVCAETEDGKIVTDTELVVWWFCLLILVGVLFYAVNF
jgi:hypothetical protein